MAVYDLEEQDQLEDLKAWWARWGNYITIVVLVICAAIVAVQGWRWWQRSQAEQASLLYTAVSDAAHKNDLSKAGESMAQLISRFASTGYTPRAALIMAKLKFDNNDKTGAKTDLQWVIDHSSEDELKQIARYRLAEVQFDQKQYDDALRTLDAKHDDAFDALYADLRGDILAASGRHDDARTAYQAALIKLDSKSPYRNYVEVKLNALGGPRVPLPGEPGFGANAADAAPGALTLPATAPAAHATTPAATAAGSPAPSTLTLPPPSASTNTKPAAPAPAAPGTPAPAPAAK